MEYNIKFIHSGKETFVSAKQGANLLSCIQSNFSDFYAPCGGNGTCGKCRVFIPGEGHVTACLYYISGNIEVFLPEKSEMKVLSSQHEVTKNVMLAPGEAANLATIPYGVAIDIGTTTMVFYFVNLVFGSVVDIVTMANPQSAYGADVISRINYGSRSPDALADLKSSLIEMVNKAINDFCLKKELSNQDFVKITVAGNTTMLHNFLGVDAISIALAPFTPVFTDTKICSVVETGLNIHPDGQVVLLPSLSGYVGADIMAGLASIDSGKLKNNYLFIDIGTNGEMVLVTEEKILACATAAGPAFEGASISCGMGAFPGAISEYSSDEMKVIGNETPKGICGSGLIDIVAYLLETENITDEGELAKDFVVSEGKKGEMDVIITQQDIREVQLAKAAVMAGIKRLLNMAGISEEELDHVLLAGGFGNYLNVTNAIKIGLLPDVHLQKYIQVGNAAGSGAVLSLKSERFLEDVEVLKKKTEYIELSGDPEFAMDYAMNMSFL